MAVQLTNNAQSLLLNDLTSVATSLTVTSGEGALFPVLGASDYFYVTLESNSSTFEIVKCTARIDNVMTITRAQENTIALPFSAGSRVQLRVTAANLLSAVNDLDFLLL